MRPIEWAILDYKRLERKKDTPLGAPLRDSLIEDLANIRGVYSYSAQPARTSRAIHERSRTTLHISPYKNGLAPETREFVEFLNLEAEEDDTGVRYIALANKIEVDGDVYRAIEYENLGAECLRHARYVGYFEGEDGVLKRGNSYWRQKLRKIAKRK